MSLLSIDDLYLVYVTGSKNLLSSLYKTSTPRSSQKTRTWWMAFLSLLEFMSSTYQSAQEAPAVLLRGYAQHEREEREEREGQQLSSGRRTFPSA